MWARKRIDISWGDLLRGASYVFSAQARGAAQNAAEHALGVDDGVIACLTERSGFDLLLEARAFPAGSVSFSEAQLLLKMGKTLTHCKSS